MGVKCKSEPLNLWLLKYNLVSQKKVEYTARCAFSWKTDKPNVFKHIDELGRILFNQDVYPMEHALSKKQNAYVENSCGNSLTLKEITGFTDDERALVSKYSYPIRQSSSKKSWK